MTLPGDAEGPGTTGAPDQRGQNGGRGVVRGAFALLRALHEAGGEARLTALSERSGLPPSTAHRLLRQLVAEGAVEFRSQRYVLGPALHELGQDWEPMPGLREAARPALRELAATGANSALVVARGKDLFVLERGAPPGVDEELDPRHHADALLHGLRPRGRAAVRGAPDAHHACVAATVPPVEVTGLIAVAVLLPSRGPVDQLAEPVARIASAIARNAPLGGPTQ